MLEKINQNKYTLFLVLGIISIGLFIPSLINLFGSFENLSIMSNNYKLLFYSQILRLILFSFASLFFVLIARYKRLDKSLITMSIIFYYVADIAENFLEYIAYKNYSSFYNIILGVLILVFTIFALTNSKFLFWALILLGIDMAFSLVETFQGSSSAFGALMLQGMLLGSIYFYNKSSILDDTYYYN